MIEYFVVSSASIIAGYGLKTFLKREKSFEMEFKKNSAEERRKILSDPPPTLPNIKAQKNPHDKKLPIIKSYKDVYPHNKRYSKNYHRQIPKNFTRSDLSYTTIDRRLDKKLKKQKYDTVDEIQLFLNRYYRIEFNSYLDKDRVVTNGQLNKYIERNKFNLFGVEDMKSPSNTPEELFLKKKYFSEIKKIKIKSDESNLTFNNIDFSEKKILVILSNTVKKTTIKFKNCTLYDVDIESQEFDLDFKHNTGQNTVVYEDNDKEVIIIFEDSKYNIISA